MDEKQPEIASSACENWRDMWYATIIDPEKGSGGLTCEELEQAVLQAMIHEMRGSGSGEKEVRE